MNPQTATDVELDWIAFCYLSDELSAEDRDVFESRLADDLTACEAVARAMQLAESMACAIPDDDRTVQSASPAPRRASGRASVAVAVAVVTLLLAIVPLFQQSDERLAVEQETQDADAIVAMWSGSRELIDQDVDQEQRPLQPSNELAGADAPEANQEIAAVDSSVDVPAWLLAAVKAESEADPTVLEN